MPWLAADEGRHGWHGHPDWREGWTFEAWGEGGTVGCTTALVLWPGLNRAWYWAAFVHAERPLVHLADLHVTIPASGLEIRAEGLWATHICEAPFEQWTIANEAYAVALDDPADALGRALGTLAPIAFDLEWYAAADPRPLNSLAGYEQDGEVQGIVELINGPVDLEGAAHRRHWWGVADPWPVEQRNAAPVAGLSAPVALDGVDLRRTLTADGWHTVQQPRQVR